MLPGIRQPSNCIVSPVQQPARFPDLRSAGRDLALALEEFATRKDVLVLGLVLGGVPVAHEVAVHLDVPLDFLIIRRLLVPDGPGSQVCAVNIAGSLVVDEAVMPPLAVPESPLDYFVSDALEGLARRARICRGNRPAVEIAQKTILLVDCGIRTGFTMRAAIRALRTKGPERIIAAVPIASPDSQAVIESIADGIVCRRWAHPFGHVGMWYKDFSRAADHQVSEMLT
jgi:putative phosphoribosyl transferase